LIYRAVYGNADIYLLDDPLSSVDAAVGSHLFKEVIQGLLKNKCVIFATHSTQHAQTADEVILIEKGNVVARGCYEELFQLGKIPTIVMDRVDDVTRERERKRGDVDVGIKTAEPSEEAEERGTGTVGLGAAWEFIRVGNSMILVSIFTGLNILNQITLSCSDYFLKIW